MSDPLIKTPQNVLDALKTIETYLESKPPSASPVPPPDTVNPPYGVLGTVMTIWGLNWDGSDDKGDIDRAGKPLKGAWGAETHNKTIVGCALPILLVERTFGGKASSHIKGFQCEVYSLVTHKTVLCDIVDLGPDARLHRLLDGTYGLHTALGHIEYGLKKYGSYAQFPAGFHVSYWIQDPSGQPIQIKGVDFAGGRIIGS